MLYELKKSYDGSTQVLLSAFEFIEKSALIVPLRYRHQVNYYECLSSHSKLWPMIVPGQQGDVESTENRAREFRGTVEEDTWVRLGLGLARRGLCIRSIVTPCLWGFKTHIGTAKRHVPWVVGSQMGVMTSNLS
jgi:hypothetical protein